MVGKTLSPLNTGSMKLALIKIMKNMEPWVLAEWGGKPGICLSAGFLKGGGGWLKRRIYTNY
jgi:hypothetical protein